MLGASASQVPRQADRTLADQDPVHPQRPGAEFTPEPGGTEGEAPGEARSQGCQTRFGCRGVDQLLKFRAGLGVRVLIEPVPGTCQDLPALRRRGRGHRAATMRASRALITGSAAAPASSTSLWLSGRLLMPAARLVISERPRISIPA